jgi:hypothetical protein
VWHHHHGWHAKNIPYTHASFQWLTSTIKVTNDCGNDGLVKGHSHDGVLKEQQLMINIRITETLNVCKKLSAQFSTKIGEVLNIKVIR